MPATLPLLAPNDSDPLSRLLRVAIATAMAAVHTLAVWTLLQLEPVRHSVGSAVPILVRLVMPPAPEPPQVVHRAPPPGTAAAASRSPATRSVITSRPRTTPVEPAFVAPPPPLGSAQPAKPEPFAAPADVVPAASPAVPAQLEPAVAAAPAPTPEARAPRDISIRAVEYLTVPVLHYPLASRQMQEEGRVHVRVLVDARGSPREMQIVRPSGYPRLDEAALATVGATRFKPYTENGVAMPFWVVMPLIFELES